MKNGFGSWVSGLGFYNVLATRDSEPETILPRKYLHERLHLDAVEHAVHHVRIARQHLPDGFPRLGIDHDQAAATIGERSGEHDLTGLDERFEMLQMCRAVLRAFLFRVGRIVPNDDE